MNKDCQAQQHSDQMICAKCGLVWDVNDPEPPECQESSAPVLRSVRSPSIQQTVVQTN